MWLLVMVKAANVLAGAVANLAIKSQLQNSEKVQNAAIFGDVYPVKSQWLHDAAKDFLALYACVRHLFFCGVPLANRRRLRVSLAAVQLRDLIELDSATKIPLREPCDDARCLVVDDQLRHGFSRLLCAEEFAAVAFSQ
jgi:hypothetical protein